MAFTKRQTGVTANSTGSSLTLASAALASTPTVGDLICVAVLFYDTTTTPPTFTVKDENNNAFTIESHALDGTSMDNAGWVGLAYLIAPSNIGKTMTVTFNKAYNGAAVIWVDDFNPNGQTATYDSGAAANGSGTINTPTIPVAGSHELVYAAASNINDDGATTGAWTGSEGGKTFGNWAEWILDVSANTAVGFVGTVSSGYKAQGMSFSLVSSSTTIPNKIVHPNQAVNRAGTY